MKKFTVKKFGSGWSVYKDNERIKPALEKSVAEEIAFKENCENEGLFFIPMQPKTKKDAENQKKMLKNANKHLHILARIQKNTIVK